MPKIDLSEYYYDLPEEKIAQYPAEERDLSKLLLYDRKGISEDIFRHIGEHLPKDSLLVFNNTRVIRARFLFSKPTGANIEIFCLEPLDPAGYEPAFSASGCVVWKCIIGNLKRWKGGPLSGVFRSGEKHFILKAERIGTEGDAFRVRFTWDDSSITFGEVMEAMGHLPLPPYINREDEENDALRYQTVYSTVKGSVAAPTAGLHFTGEILRSLTGQGISTAELTLHVGAGTFQPVRSNSIHDHEMHCEHFFVSLATIEKLLKNTGRIIPVGTTSVRTLESLYWIGCKIIREKLSVNGELTVGQWEPYDYEETTPVADALMAIIENMKVHRKESIEASTRIIIVPGYKFRVMNGLITNFHQPGSTLLLLVSAWTGDDWKKIYHYALSNNFRFLSYGDSSLLLR